MSLGVRRIWHKCPFRPAICSGYRSSGELTAGEPFGNGFKLFDQNLALTGGNPGKLSQLLALNIYDTMYGMTGWQGVGQAKAVIFFILVAVIAIVQNKLTTSKEVTD